MGDLLPPPAPPFPSSSPLTPSPSSPPLPSPPSPLSLFSLFLSLSLFLSTGAFDSVNHAGDWAYGESLNPPHYPLPHAHVSHNTSPPRGRSDLEDLFSVQGNLFMNLVQGYAATKPMMPR